jgi:hypothetical protein
MITHAAPFPLRHGSQLVADFVAGLAAGVTLTRAPVATSASQAAPQPTLIRILAEGAIGICGVTRDKFGGRVYAKVSTAPTRDVSAVMRKGGFAWRYSGGRRESWCG